MTQNQFAVLPVSRSRVGLSTVFPYLGPVRLARFRPTAIVVCHTVWDILLTAKDDIRLADFDASVRIGEKLLVASEPFCKLNEDFELPYAGPVSEQFSLASCIYTIRLGHLPHYELDAPDRIKKLIGREFPATAQDVLFGDVILKCWLGEYASLDAIYKDVESREDLRSYRLLLAECEEFCRSADNE